MDAKEFEEKYANGELDDLAEELYEECEKIKEEYDVKNKS